MRLGKQAFAEKLMKLGEGVSDQKRKARSYDASPERQAHGEQNALALMKEGLRLANLSADELAGHRCTEPRKVLLAGLLWKKTTAVSQAWIAEYRGMKNAVNLSRVIHCMELSRSEKKVSTKMARFVSEN